MAKYDEHIYKGTEKKANILTSEEMRKAFQEAGRSATGPDGYEPGEMTLLSEEGYHYMAELLNMVEGRAPLAITVWPAANGRKGEEEERTINK